MLETLEKQGKSIGDKKLSVELTQCVHSILWKILAPATAVEKIRFGILE